MAQAAEAAPFPNGESGLSSTHSSVDVTAVLRNLKLRRVSCSTAAVPATAASLDANYDTTLSRSHLPLDAKFSAYGILSADTQTDANSSVANGNTDDAASPGPDAVGSESAALFVHRWGGYANPATPSTLSSSGLHAQSTNATPSPLRPKTSDGSSQSVGASPLTTPGPVVRPTFLAFPPASPDEAASRAGHTGPPADAYTALSPAASVPALAPLSAALEAALSQGARQQPAPPPSPPPPLKAASSMALLGQHHAHLAALHGDAVARPPLSAASSQRAFTPGAIGSPASIGNGSGALGVGGSFGGVGGLAALAEAHLSSRSASPSVRPSRVAATVFAATSAIVAATSVVVAGGGGGNAAAVAAAAAEVARDIADSVSRSPTVPPRPPSQALAKVAAAAAAAATNSSRASVDFSADAQRSAGVSSGGGAPFWAPHGTVFGAASPAGGGGGSGGGGGGGPSLSSSMSSLRRSSLELQIAKLKSAPDSPGGVPTAAASAAAANGHSNGYSNGHSNGQASSLQQSPAQRERLPETPTRPAHIITDGSGSSGGGGGPLSPGLLPPAGSAPPSPFAATAAMAAAAGGAGPAAAAASAAPPSPASAAAGAASTTALPTSAGPPTSASTSTPPRSALAKQRTQLLDELQAAHKRELALAEQLGRARAEVLELTAQLARQTEAAAAAAAAAEAESGTVAELRGQLRKTRIEAGEEVRRWRSRATAAEEQLQTALTQLACLRSAAAAVVARNSVGGGNGSSGGGSAVMAAAAAVAAAAVGLSQGDGQGQAGGGSPGRAAQAPSASSSGPGSPALPPLPRGSPPDVKLDPHSPTPPLRRSLSHQTLGLEGGVGVAAKPPRAVSTSGAAQEGEEEGYAVGASTGGAGGRSSGGGVLMGSPPEHASSRGAGATAAAARPPRRPDGGGGGPQSPASSATTAVGADGGGSAAGVSTPASATVSYGSSYGSPVSQERSPYEFGFGRGGSGSGSGGGGEGGSGAEECDAGVAAAAAATKGRRKGTGVPPGGRSSTGGGAAATAKSGSQGGAGAEASVGGWASATAEAAAAAGDDDDDDDTQVPTSFSVPPSNLNPYAGPGQPARGPIFPISGHSSLTTERDSSDSYPRLTPSASAALPGSPAASCNPRSPGGSAMFAAAVAGLSPEMIALAAVPEGADGTAVLRSSGPISPAAAAGPGGGCGKGEAAAAALLAAEVERLKQAGNRAYRSDQYPLARHCYTCALELLLAPGGADAASPGGVGGAVGVMSSDGGGAERPAAAAVAAARERAAAVAAAANGGGDGAAVGRTPGERRMISALYCSRAAAHVAMQLYADAVADCCAATAHDEAYAKPWKCRAEALASVNAFGPAAAALERCIQLTTAAEAAAAAAAANPSAAKAAGKAALAATSSGSISIGGALAAGASSGELVEFNDVDPRELPLLRHILQRLQELTRAAATPSLPAAAALLAAVHGAPAAAPPPVDHYAILGVPYHASAVDVRAAYRRLALRYHPDKAAAAAAAAGAGAGASPPAAAVVAAAGTVFPMVAEAYAVLSDSASRRAYDLRRARVTLGSRRFAGR
ncbi:Cytochrome c oxidase subunit 1 [Pleodorina starrii]|uniref:Cytochrome c oxidase subunit 1 n=1 Tax=Pleodorina starrii TaxID=330485 RepID=A0A9W6BIK2_9CHLO|nr:Cytochrome c oxidase subunit 1 [Pleodorina starrii]